MELLKKQPKFPPRTHQPLAQKSFFNTAFYSDPAREARAIGGVDAGASTRPASERTNERKRTGIVIASRR